MYYSEIFEMQWKTFCNDFKVNVAKRKNAGLKAATLDQWYELNIHRWESSIETEGTILEQQNNQELSSRLLSELQTFRFQDVEIIHEGNAVLMGCLGMVAGFVLAVVEYVANSVLLAHSYCRCCCSNFCFEFIKRFTKSKRK